MKLEFRKYGKKDKAKDFSNAYDACLAISGAKALYDDMVGVCFVWRDGGVALFETDAQGSLEEICKAILRDERFVREFSHYLKIDGQEVFSHKGILYGMDISEEWSDNRE